MQMQEILLSENVRYISSKYIVIIMKVRSLIGSEKVAKDLFVVCLKVMTPNQRYNMQPLRLCNNEFNTPAKNNKVLFIILFSISCILFLRIVFYGSCLNNHIFVLCKTLCWQLLVVLRLSSRDCLFSNCKVSNHNGWDTHLANPLEHKKITAASTFWC